MLEIIMSLGFCVLYFLGMALFILAFKWILAVYAVLSGDKDALKDCGNLCDADVPWDSYSSEVRKPGDRFTPKLKP